MRILFWGTPEFAVPPLEALLGEGFDVVGVVTQPDRPVGRTRVLTPPPVKQVALREGLPVLQPERPRGEAFLAELTALGPDLNVVVAYGHILPIAVIEHAPRRHDQHSRVAAAGAAWCRPDRNRDPLRRHGNRHHDHAHGARDGRRPDPATCRACRFSLTKQAASCATGSRSSARSR